MPRTLLNVRLLPLSPLSFSPTSSYLPGKAEIDKAAAGRFIKAAISSASFQKPGPEANTPVSAEPSSSRVPVKVTAKMAERAEYEQTLKEDDGKEEEDEDLEVIGEDGKMAVDEEEPTGRRKRQRPAVDPFAGTWSLSCTHPPVAKIYTCVCRLWRRANNRRAY